MDLPAHYREPRLAARIALVAESHARLLGRPLIPPGADPVSALWVHERPVVAHGTEDDPLFFYANRAALAVFETTLAAFLGMPSRYSAEAPDRAERQRLLERVAAHHCIDDYRGQRISAKGRRFTIEGAVWDLLDIAGVRHGQAATFRVVP